MYHILFVDSVAVYKIVKVFTNRAFIVLLYTSKIVVKKRETRTKNLMARNIWVLDSDVSQGKKRKRKLPIFFFDKLFKCFCGWIVSYLLMSNEVVFKGVQNLAENKMTDQYRILASS